MICPAITSSPIVIPPAAPKKVYSEKELLFPISRPTPISEIEPEPIIFEYSPNLTLFFNTIPF